MFTILIGFSIVFVTCFGEKLPDFILSCSRNDPNLNACALKNGATIIPRVVQGYRPYNLPSLAPLYIPRIDIQAGAQLKVELTENKVFGLEDTTLKDVDFNLDKKHLIFKVHIPRANIVGHYKMNGQILILPIQGEGPANLTLMNGDYIYSLDYKLVPKKGKEYISVTNHSITFTTTRAYYRFGNLFNGNSILAQEVDKFLDENWKDVTKDLGSTVAETISSIITSIAQNIATHVPYDDLFPK